MGRPSSYQVRARDSPPPGGIIKQLQRNYVSIGGLKFPRKFYTCWTCWRIGTERLHDYFQRIWRVYNLDLDWLEHASCVSANLIYFSTEWKETCTLWPQTSEESAARMDAPLTFHRYHITLYYPTYYIKSNEVHLYFFSWTVFHCGCHRTIDRGIVLDVDRYDTLAWYAP